MYTSNDEGEQQMPDEKSPLLQVRVAADMLGVHENTLRRWHEAGLIHAVRLPSGVRRFRPEDIQKIRRQMYTDVAEEALHESEATSIVAR
jgi:hypothetical protein